MATTFLNPARVLAASQARRGGHYLRIAGAVDGSNAGGRCDFCDGYRACGPSISRLRCYSTA